MAIIYSYPLNQPKRDDLLIGTITYDEDAVNPIHGNPTVSFTVGSLLDLVSGQGNAQNLQQVTNIGNTTTNSIIVSNSLKVSGGYYDSSNQPGSSGQVLSSTATGTQWVNVAVGGVTSIAQSHEGNAFSVTGSPITSTGTLAIEMEGSALQYINGLGNLVLLSTLPQGAVTSLTTTGTSGASTLTSGVLNIPNYANTQNTLTTIGTSGVATLVGEVLNIPNYTYTYTLPVATDTDLGGVKIGYTTDATARNYAVTLDTEQMLVNVPWTDTPYVLPLAADGTRGGVQIGYTQTATRDYPVTLDSEKMLVTVPWTDTPPNPFQTITGTGSDNTDSGILLSDSGGTVLILGDGSVTAAQTGNTITLTGTDTGITGVTLAIADSTGEPLLRTITNRELTLTSAKYVGGANVGYVPEGGTGTTYLKGDGTWASIPTGLIFKGTWDARNTAEGGASDGGDPDLDGIAGAADGWLYIVSTAGSAVPNGAATTPNSWNLGDWCVYDGTNWTRIPATNAGVTSVTTTDGDFVELTPTAATTGAITVTADLSATGTQDSTTFLRGDNTWDVPVTGVTSITGQEPITIVTTGGPTATTPRVDLRYVDTGGNTPNDDNVVTAALSADTDTLDNDDTLIINDKVDTRTTPLYNTVKKFTLQRLKTFIGAGNITAVNTDSPLTGGGAGPGALTLGVNYSADSNIVLSSYNQTETITTTSSAVSGATQLLFANTAGIRPGMIADINGADRTVTAVPDNTTVSFSPQTLGSNVGSGDNITFTTVLSTSSKLMFNNGTGTDAYVSNSTLSTIGLSLFDNDVPFLTSAVTSITGQAPISIYTTNPYSALSPRIDLNYEETGTNTDDNIITAASSAGTDTLADSDLFLAADISTTTNKVKKFTMTRLKTYVQDSTLTGVAGRYGLTGSGTSGYVNIDVEYSGTGNVILTANTPTTLIDANSIMIVNTDSGANASVNQIAISDVPLSYFSNTASGFTNNTGTLTGVTGAEPLYSVTTGGGSATVPQIKLRYNEDTAGNNDSIITAAPAFGAGTADPSDLIIISDQSTSLNETKKIALSQLGFGSSSGTVEQVDTGGGLTGGPFSVTGTISVMYTGTNNVILDATASTDHESTSRMMLNYDNGGGSIPVVNEMKLEDIQLGYFDNNLDWVVLGNTSTTALAGDTTTITTAQADEITANTAKTGITTAQANAIVANTAKVGITTTQANDITANNAKVTDSGIPAILSDGTLNRTAALIRSDIGAGTPYTLTVADSTTLGGIELGSDVELGGTYQTGNIGTNTRTYPVQINSENQAAVYVPWTNTQNSEQTLNAIGSNNTDSGIQLSKTGANDVVLILGAGSVSVSRATSTLTITGTDTVYTLPLAASGTRGGVQIGYTESGKNYPVELSSEKMFVNVPWTDNNSVDYINAATFNTGNGILTGTGVGNAGFAVDLDGRYLTSYTETDTLADVTGRGASTSTACSFTNTGAQTFGSGGSSDVYLGNTGTNKFIRFHTNNINTYFDMNCGFVYWRQASSTRFEQNMTNGTFTASGDVVAFGSPSDKRLKENIKPIESALDKAMKLQGVTFDWKKSDSILSIKKDIGFIAQDVQKVAPELVRENEDGYLSMRHQGITPILLEAIKELKAEIEELKLNKCNCNK